MIRGDYVIKIPITERGVIKNKREAELCELYPERPYAKVYFMKQDILVMERLQELSHMDVVKYVKQGKVSPCLLPYVDTLAECVKTPNRGYGQIGIDSNGVAKYYDYEDCWRKGYEQ